MGGPQELEDPSVQAGDAFPRFALDVRGDSLGPERPRGRLASQALPNGFPFAIAAADRTVVASEFAKDPRYAFLAGVERSSDFAATVGPESIVL
ncbi:MAG: hypothetical protein OXN97_06500 [Bryobacterales bacterium]|nr:hypothetical protein [Bryobacterales bacterium]